MAGDHGRASDASSGTHPFKNCVQKHAITHEKGAPGRGAMKKGRR